MLSGLYKFLFEKRKYIYIYFIIFIAYYAVVLLIHPLKYDFFDEFYPKRYFLTHNLRNGIIPLWCPYQHAGFPFYADPSGAFFYPLTWIISIFNDYTLVVGHFEFIFHLCIAATGFYKLGSLFVKDQNICSMLALSYALGGFFTGNAQHYPWIISATWMPLVFYSFLNTLNRNRLIDILLTSVYIMLFITGGYPAFTFVVVYIFIIIICYKIFLLIKQNEKKKIRQIFQKAFLLLIISIILCLGYLISIYISSQYISRGEELTLAQVMEFPFSPKALISLIIPYVSVKLPMEIFNADMSVTNAYMGLVSFIFFIVSVSLKKDKKLIFLIISTLIVLFVSFGEGFLLRKLLYDYVPLMNLFRFPSLFRIFFIIGALILSGISLEFYLNKKIYLRKISYIPLVLIVVLLIAVLYARYNDYIGIAGFIKNGLFKQSVESTFTQHFVFQAVVQCLILLSVFIFLRYFSNIQKLTSVLLTIVSLDLIISFWLNAPYTVYYQSFRVRDVTKYEKSFPEDYPYPSNKTLINTLNTDYSYGPYWQNLPTFFKQISSEGRNPFKLKNFLDLKTNYTTLFDSTLNNKVAYLSRNIYPVDSIEAHITDNKIKSKNIYLTSGIQEINKDDTFSIKNESIEFVKFYPTNMKFSVNAENPAYFILLQSYYPGWKATINNRTANIEKVNLSFMGVFLPQGNSVIEFKLERPFEKAGLFISFTSFIMVVILTILLNRRNNSKTEEKNIY